MFGGMSAWDIMQLDEVERRDLNEFYELKKDLAEAQVKLWQTRQSLLAPNLSQDAIDTGAEGRDNFIEAVVDPLKDRLSQKQSELLRSFVGSENLASIKEELVAAVKGKVMFIVTSSFGKMLSGTPVSELLSPVALTALAQDSLKELAPMIGERLSQKTRLPIVMELMESDMISGSAMRQMFDQIKRGDLDGTGGFGGSDDD